MKYLEIVKTTFSSVHLKLFLLLHVFDIYSL